MKSWVLFGAAIFTAIGSGAWWMSGEKISFATNGAFMPDLAAGAEIYAQACVSCHGANLEGQPEWKSPGPNGRLPAPPHDASGHTWHHPDRLLLDITMRGTEEVVGGGYESDMPGFSEQYSKAELRDVLAWIKSQWPEHERTYQAQITAQDEAQQ